MAKKVVDLPLIVSVGPLIDDGDFKSLETSIAFNAPGMSVDLFQETRLSLTKTDITPTSGSTNDWTHKGNGVYELEITAAQNDATGVLWVVGVADGVLPFESPRYEVVPLNIYNSLVTGTDALQVDTTEISGDSVAADNFETMLDGTGGNVLTLKQLYIMAENGDSAIYAVGEGTGSGIQLVGGSSGHGFESLGGPGGHGMYVKGTTGGHGILAEGATTGSGLKAVGGTTGNGLLALGGSSGGEGLRAEAQNAGNKGLHCIGVGGGPGIRAWGGSTAPGLETIGGSSSGDGIRTLAQTNGAGLRATGSGGVADILGGITGDITGDLSGSVGSVSGAVGSVAGTINELAATAKSDVQSEVDTALAAINLDHLMKTAVASNSDMTTEVSDGTVLSNIMSKTSDTSTYVVADESLEAIGDSISTLPTVNEIRDGILDDATRFSGADVAAILTDTGTTIPGTITTLTSKVDTVDGVADAILVDTDVIGAAGVGLSDLGGMSTSMKAEVQSEANDALVAQKLDHLVAEADADDVANDSIMAKIASKGATADWSDYTPSTDSQEALRDFMTSSVTPSIVSGSSMSGSGFLSDTVSLIRKLTDEPSTNPKYTNTDIIDLLQAGFSTVLTEVNINSDHPILVRHDITLVSGTLDYILPPQVGEIWRVAKIASGGYTPVYEAYSDNHWSGHQSGFVIEGNVFRLLNDWRSSDTLQILFVPLGEPLLHYGTADASAEDGSTLTLAGTPTDGTLDTRADAYAGYILRVLSSTESDEDYIQERTITAYDHITRVATVSPVFNPTLEDGTLTYEVIPAYSGLLKHVVCMQVALDILGIEGNKKRMETMGQRFAVKMRALKLLVSKKSGRYPGHMLGDTSDNENRRDW